MQITQWSLEVPRTFTRAAVTAGLILGASQGGTAQTLEQQATPGSIQNSQWTRSNTRAEGLGETITLEPSQPGEQTPSAASQPVTETGYAQDLAQLEDPNPEEITTPEVVRAKPNRLYLGPDIFYRDYSEEEITPGFKSDESGVLFGVQATYDYVKQNSVYFGGSLRYGGGQTSYDGGLQFADGTRAPYESTTDNQIFNVEGRLGYSFLVDQAERLLLTPFIGYGYHRWNRTISGDGEIPGFGDFPINDLTEIYSWRYIAPGLRTEYQLSPKFDIGLNLKVMFMQGGDIKIEDPTGDIDTNLGNETQFEVELPLTYHVSETERDAFDIRLTPYYRSMNIGRGDVGCNEVGFCALEPASTTSVFGATIGAQYRF